MATVLLLQSTMSQALNSLQQQASAWCAPQRPVAARHLLPQPLARLPCHTAARATHTYRCPDSLLKPAQGYYSSHAHQRQWHRLVCAALAAEQQQDSIDEVLLLADQESHSLDTSQQDDEHATPFGLPLPDAQHQRPLEFKAIKLLRTQSNTLAAQKQLMNIQAGQNGITQSFLSACMDILSKHEFVRVRLGEGSGLERKTTAAGLEKLLDCICVHQIGYTVTLYRQKGLPRPSNCPSNAQPAAADTDLSEAPQVEQHVQQGQNAAATGKGQRGNSKHKPRVSRKPVSKLPPEFKVV